MDSVAHGDMSPLVETPTKELPLHASQHRASFVDYVLEHAAPWHRQHLGRLYDLWAKWNRDYFESRMVPSYILLSEPSNPRRYGDCGPISGFGGTTQIRIRPSLLTGTHPDVCGGDQFSEGRFLFVADILLHEMIHQWHQEVTGVTEDSYHGHGPKFCEMCNQIGERLGIAEVYPKPRGKTKGKPGCQYWPHVVRPDDDYLGAYIRPTNDDKSIADQPETLTIPTEPQARKAVLSRLLTADEAAEWVADLVDAFNLNDAPVHRVLTSRDISQAAPKERAA